MLSFLSPLFLFAAAAAAVPVVLHFLNKQPEARVKFSAVKLLREAPVEHTQRRRLRQLLLLALRVTALLLLALAFARPFFATGAAVASSGVTIRSEEHTSELQSHHDLVCRLLLEKK